MRFGTGFDQMAYTALAISIQPDVIFQGIINHFAENQAIKLNQLTKWLRFEHSEKMKNQKSSKVKIVLDSVFLVKFYTI